VDELQGKIENQLLEQQFSSDSTQLANILWKVSLLLQQHPFPPAKNISDHQNELSSQTPLFRKNPEKFLQNQSDSSNFYAGQVPILRAPHRTRTQISVPVHANNGVGQPVDDAQVINLALQEFYEERRANQLRKQRLLRQGVKYRDIQEDLSGACCKREKQDDRPIDHRPSSSVPVSLSVSAPHQPPAGARKAKVLRNGRCIVETKMSNQLSAEDRRINSSGRQPKQPYAKTTMETSAGSKTSLKGKILAEGPVARKNNSFCPHTQSNKSVPKYSHHMRKGITSKNENSISFVSGTMVSAPQATRLDSKNTLSADEPFAAQNNLSALPDANKNCSGPAPDDKSSKLVSGASGSVNCVESSAENSTKAEYFRELSEHSIDLPNVDGGSCAGKDDTAEGVATLDMILSSKLAQDELKLKDSIKSLQHSSGSSRAALPAMDAFRVSTGEQHGIVFEFSAVNKNLADPQTEGTTPPAHKLFSDEM
jgi:hypothetical protein